MKTVDKLAHKYALNIKQIRGPIPTKLSDYKTLNRGFYDEIEEDSQNIHKFRKNLIDVKNSSIKEFIYTNKEIPEKWKNKITYKDDLIQLMAKDKNLLSYVGTSPSDTLPNSRNNLSLKTETNFPTINNNERYKRHKSPEIQNNKITKLSNNVSNYSFSKTGLNKKNYNDKEVINLLDDFKSAYPIREKLEQLYVNTNYYNTNDNISRNNTFHKTSNSMFSFHNMLTEKRQNVFRQNVFNNLTKTDNTKKIKYNFIKDKAKYSKTLFGIDHEHFIKKVEINDPIINKNLESINYFGPYFSHCPPCRNRNLEYYRKLEPKQCLDIIHQIKKIRFKKTLMDIGKSKDTNQYDEDVKNEIEDKNNLTAEQKSDLKSLKSDKLYEEELRDNYGVEN